MAGRGTGLPNTGPGGLTPLVDFSGSAGIGERAEAEAWGQINGIAQSAFDTFAKPQLVERARQDAARAVEAGEFEDRLAITDVGRAYNDIVRTGLIARNANADDDRLTDIYARNLTNPDGFEAEAEAYRSAVIEATDPRVVGERAETLDRRRFELSRGLRVDAAKQAASEAAKDIVARRTVLSAGIAAALEAEGSFDRANPAVAGKLAELDELWSQTESSPLLGVGPAEVARLRSEELDGFQAAAVAGHVRRVFRADGPDAALAELQDLLPSVEGGTFSTPSAAQAPGRVEVGNIDLSTRPQVQNADGSVSTVRSTSIEVDGRIVLIPTVTEDGRVVADDEAFAIFSATGRHLGVFATEADATRYAVKLHEDQAAGRVSEADTGRSPRAMQLAYDLASEAIQQELGLAQQRANIAAATRTQADQRVTSLIEAMRYGGDVDPNELRAAAQATGDPGTIARARWAIEVGVTPPEGFGGSGGAGGGSGSFDGDASAAGGFEAWSEFFFEAEGGDVLIENDNGRGPSRWGINATANPDLDIRGMAGEAGKRIAQRRLREQYWNAIGGDRLPPALAFVAADAAAVAGPGRANAWIEQADGDVGRFLAFQEEHYRSLAQRDPAKYGDDLRGWLNRMGRARGMAARIQSFQNTQGGFSGDPLTFALGNSTRPALAQVAPLQVDAVFNAPQQWAQVMQGRRATGDTLARQYQVPRRMLTDGEVAAYKNRFDADPASVISFAQQATAALGGQGARDLLAEIGQGGAAPVLIHIADLARPGGDVRFAQQAALGLSLKANGQTLDTDRRAEVNREIDDWRSLLATTPALLAAVQNSAQAAALADEVSGVVRPADYYPQAALGRTTWGRNRYGGATEVNGAKVIVPRWLNGDRFDDALEALAESWASHGGGPVFGNGEPMPARTSSRLRPVLQANGNYRFRDTRGSTAVGRDGQPFEVNMSAARTLLSNRLGRDVVRPD